MLTHNTLIRMTVMFMAAGTVPGMLGAQEREKTCGQGEVVTGALGYERLECECSVGLFKDEPGHTVYEFRSEPRIWGITEHGPASSKLKEGDVVVAVDGYLITTAEGGMRFGNVVPGVPVTLTVRRGGEETDVTVTPEAKCLEVDPEAPPPVLDVVAAPERPRWVPRAAAPADPSPPPAPPEQDVLPEGWMGLSFSCSDCAVGLVEGETAWVWDFTSPPLVERVEALGPAEAAGLQPGDVLTHVDGAELTSEEGGRRLGAVQPGDTVVFRYTRNGEERTAQLIAGERLAIGGEPFPPPKREREVTRFSGVVGNAFIEVTGGPISVSRTEDEVVIRSQDITVRIKRTGN
ncbi:MAG: PDZ domain-containing protein [Gemmatimonadales bacterium]|jgi:hypothetical protein